MTGKIFSFCQDSKNVNNNHYRGREKENTLIKRFNDRHIKNTRFVLATFLEL